MGESAFGCANIQNTAVTTMYALDRSYSSVNHKYIAWPVENMSTEYFSTNSPWSVSVGRSVDKRSTSVTLKNVNSGKIWNFNSNGSDGFFNVDNGGYGTTGCIIFRPDGIGGYNNGDIYEVEIYTEELGDILHS